MARCVCMTGLNSGVAPVQMRNYQMINSPGGIGPNVDLMNDRFLRTKKKPGLARTLLEKKQEHPAERVGVRLCCWEFSKSKALKGSSHALRRRPSQWW